MSARELCAEICMISHGKGRGMFHDIASQVRSMQAAHSDIILSSALHQVVCSDRKELIGIFPHTVV